MRDSTGYEYPDDPFSFGNTKRMDAQIKDEKEILKKGVEKEDVRQNNKC